MNPDEFNTPTPPSEPTLPPQPRPGVPPQAPPAPGMPMPPPAPSPVAPPTLPNNAGNPVVTPEPPRPEAPVVGQAQPVGSMPPNLSDNTSPFGAAPAGSKNMLIWLAVGILVIVIGVGIFFVLK